MMTTHGGAARRPAARARHGHRLRAAPAARHHHRRRPARSRRCSRSTRRRSSTSTWSGSRARAPRGAGAGASRRCAAAASHEHLGALHPPADRDLAAGRRASCSPGAAAYSQLPVAPLPRVDFPTISVTAALPGASPETMASAVATPLERRFGRIAGVTEMTSTSSLGATSASPCSSISTATSTSAARDVQAAINAAGGELPANLPTRPNYRKVNPADAPILILSLTLGDAAAGAGLRRRQHRARAEDLAGRRASGRSSSAAGSSRRCACRSIRRRWPASGSALEDVRTALARVDGRTSPRARSAGDAARYTIAANDQLFGADGLPAR